MLCILIRTVFFISMYTVSKNHSPTQEAGLSGGKAGPRYPLSRKQTDPQQFPRAKAMTFTVVTEAMLKGKHRGSHWPKTG